MITPIIMCGGMGSRLWPLSRKLKPKQFHKINSEHSLFQETLLRFKDKKLFTNPIILCSDSEKFYVLDQSKEVNIKLKKVITEPVPRNTLPAIAIASIYLDSINSNDIALVVSSDQKISPQSKYINSVKLLSKESLNNEITIFGIPVRTPHTGYGYIKLGKNVIEKRVFQVDSFIEKPNIKKAKAFMRSKKYLWNIGMFAFKPKIILNAIDKIDPALLEFFKTIFDNSISQREILNLPLSQFKKVIPTSIDKGIIEKLSEHSLPLSVIKLEIDWHDLGSWNSIFSYYKNNKKIKQKNSNIEIGDVVSINSENSLLFSDNKLLTSVGVKDIIAVQTKDATLIASQSESESIKDLFNLLDTKKRIESEAHIRVDRPWGNFESIQEEKLFHAKKLVIKPKAQLSLQSHQFRSEHWIVVDGKAKVLKGSKEFLLKKNDYIFIPKKVKHTIKNPFSKACTIIEVQTGTYFGEDDIKRYKDIYGRV